MITLEVLSDSNIEDVRRIQRDDISEAFVDAADTIGLILLGEAFEWDTDPEEMKGVPFYRLMGFVIDKRYRSGGIGGYVLEKVIEMIYRIWYTSDCSWST